MPENEGRILIVEDQKPIRDLLRINLSNRGVPEELIDFADSEPKALEAINAKAYDIILLDGSLDLNAASTDEPNGVRIAKAIKASKLNASARMFNTSSKYKNPEVQDWLTFKESWNFGPDMERIVQIRNEILSGREGGSH